MAGLARIGRYQVREAIGVGGFAEVLRAWDDEFDTPVAIKVLLPALVENAAVADRFVGEARLLRRITHPNVVAVHDLGTLDDGRPYFVLDYAERGTLGDRLTPGVPTNPASLTPVIEALAAGLTALHQADIVHRDIKPDNLLITSSNQGRDRRAMTEFASDLALLAEDETIVIGDLGLAKNLDGGGDVSVLGGTPGYQAPEQRSGTGVVSPATDVFGASAVLYRMLVGHEWSGGRADEYVSEPGWIQFFERSMSVDPTERFGSMTEWKAVALELVDASDATVVERTPSPATDGIESPYMGLAAFQPNDSERFHGRDVLVEQLTSRIAGERVLVVGGPSGSGKSSVVRAGLIPSFGEKSARVLLMTPGHEPLDELTYQISTLGDAWSAPDANSIRSEPRRIRAPVAAAITPPEQLILVIDQFEELYTHSDDLEDRAAFVAALDSLVSAADSVTRLVIAVRADFYGACAHNPTLARWISDNQVLVGPMSEEELRSAIVQPAHQAGVRLESGLTDRVLRDAGTQTGALPLVSHALLETWRHRSTQQLTIADYEAVGGVAGAISGTAETLYADRFDEPQRRATRRLMLRLVTPGEGAADTRRRLLLAEVERDVDPAIQRQVVTALSDARLITLHDDHLEIAHEALIGTWPRLRSWIDEERQNLRRRQRVSRSAADWDSAGRDPDLLYRGTPLASALEWADENEEHVDSLEWEFLQESRRHRDSAVEAEETRAASARRARIIGVAALALLALAAMVASVVAFGAARDARDNQDVAEQRFAAALGAQGSATARSDPYLAMNLALESTARSDPPDAAARSALLEARDTLQALPLIPTGAPLSVDDALTVALSPDGTLIAIGGRDGTIRLWDLSSHREIGEAETAHTGGVNDIAFTPDGATMVSVAAGDDRGEIIARSVDQTGLGSPELFANDSAQMWSVDVSSDGDEIVTSSEDGVVSVWDLSTREPIGEPLEDRLDRELEGASLSAVNVVAFADDDGMIITADDAGLLFGWSWPDRMLVFGPIEAQAGSEAFELVVAEDGSVLVGGSNGTIERTDVEALRSAKPGTVLPIGANRGYAGIVYDEVRGVLHSGADDGAVHTLVSETEHTSPAAHAAPIIDAALSASTLVTLSNDHTAMVWTVADERSAPAMSEVVDELISPIEHLAVPETVDGGTVTAATSFDDRILLATDAGVIGFWDGGTLDALDVSLDGIVVELRFAANGNTIAAGTDSGELSVIDLDDDTIHAPIEVSDEAVVAIDFTPSGSAVIAASFDGSVGVYSSESGNQQASIAIDDAIRDAVVDPLGTAVVVAGNGGSIQRYSLEDGSPIGSPFIGADGGAWSVIYLDDGHTLVGGDGKGTVHFWDVQTGDRMRSSTHHEIERGRSQNPVLVLAVDPTRPDVFYSAASDGSIRRWDPLDRDRTCELARPTFDERQRDLNLGEGVQPMGCDDA